MQTTKFSDWSASQGGLTTNSTFASDASGGSTAARLSDNGTVAQHAFNGPNIPVLPGQPMEDDRLMLGVGVQYAQVFMQGDSGAKFGVEVDLKNGKILGAIQSGGGVLTAASIGPGAGGYFVIRTTGTLGANDSNARQWVVMESTPGTATYAGSGSDIYMDSTAAFPDAVYIAPIHTVTGPPVQRSAPSVSLTAGSPGVGGTYTVGLPSYVNGAASFAYQWMLDGVTPISGATAASFTPTSAQSGHTIACQVTATNPSGSSVALSSAASVGSTWTVNPGNLVPNQQFGTGAGWTNPIGAGQSCVITPNYTAAGFGPDGFTYPTRVQWNGDFNTEILCAVAAHAAGFQSLFARTNPVTGDAAVYLNLRNSTSDNNFNIDNSTGTGSNPPTQGLPTGKWDFLQGAVNANDGFSLFCRLPHLGRAGGQR